MKSYQENIILLQVTNAGIQAAAQAQSGGPKITITAFKVGSAYGYTPSVNATALTGTILYSGSPSNYAVNSENEVIYTLLMNELIGDFNFGEIGLYLEDGTLFAIGTYNTPQPKLHTTGQQVGNIVSIQAKIKLNNVSPVINFPINNIALAQILQVGGISLLVPPILSDSNAYFTGDYDDGGSMIYAFRSADYQWSYPSHSNIKVAGQVTSVDTGSDALVAAGKKIVSTNIGTSLNDLVTGEYIIEFITGSLKGYSRMVSAQGANNCSWQAPLGAIPQVGDQFLIYQSNYSVLKGIGNISGDAFINAIWQNAPIAPNSGTADVILANYNPAINQWTANLMFYVIVNSPNTTPTPTISPNGITPKTIVNYDGSPLPVGILQGVIQLRYDITSDKVWLVTASQEMPRSSNVGGTADAITAIFAPGISQLSDGLPVSIRSISVNTTTTPTFTPNSGTIAAKQIVKGANQALVAGDIAGAGHWLELQYDATLDKWVLQNPAYGVNSTGGKLLRITRYTTAGSGTWTKQADTNSILVRAVGGGGGGGGATSGSNLTGNGGNSGCYGEKLITAPSASYAYVVGAAGGGGAVGAAGSAGGQTSFGALTLNGGGGGATATGAIPALATGSGWDFTSASPGGAGSADSSTNIHGNGGLGGPSPFAGGGSQMGAGSIAGNYGSGGGGGSRPSETAAAGTAGGAGYIEVWEFA